MEEPSGAFQGVRHDGKEYLDEACRGLRPDRVGAHQAWAHLRFGGTKSLPCTLPARTSSLEHSHITLRQASDSCLLVLARSQDSSSSAVYLGGEGGEV